MISYLIFSPEAPHTPSLILFIILKRKGILLNSFCRFIYISNFIVSISNPLFYPAYKKISSLFGRLSYGCCEPVHSFWEKSISKFENLRKISISPWCNRKNYRGFIIFIPISPACVHERFLIV